MLFFSRFLRLLRAWMIRVALFGAVFSGWVSAAEVSLGQLNHIFTGNPLSAAATTLPAGLPLALTYRSLATQSSPAAEEVVFDNTPSTLALSYSSYPVANQRAVGLGNYLKLAGNARRLKSCEVTLVTWSRASQFPVLAALNPAGYVHPINVVLYAVTPDLRFTYLADADENILVPWRPEQLPNGQPYPYNGYAFRARFNFPAAVTLPEQVMVMVNYNTETSGFIPLLVPGPYNSLNIALEGSTPSVGSDVNPDVVLRVTNDAWFYPNTGWSGFNGPPVRITATDEISKTPPVAPGQYAVTALVGAGGTEGTASGVLTIAPPTLAAWENRVFTSDEIQAGEAQPDADPDGDGLTNLAEYAMGTLPTIPTPGLPVTEDPAAMALTLQRPRYLGGVQYIAEETFDFVTWTPVPLSVVSSNSATETVRAEASTEALNSRRAFLRIRFTP